MRATDRGDDPRIALIIDTAGIRVQILPDVTERNVARVDDYRHRREFARLDELSAAGL